MEALYNRLREALGNEDAQDFNLDEHGYIILLEPEDDLRHLPGIGLDHLPEGLLGTWPEYVEEINLNNLCLYKILILYDNEYGHIFLSVKGQLNKEAEEWLQRLSEW